MRSSGGTAIAAHIKLIFGQNGVPGELSLATSDSRPAMRTYTPPDGSIARHAELDADFILHGEGPASLWAAQAATGQTLTVAGPGRHYVVDPSAKWYLLAGDDTAIPAISTILEAPPAGARARVFIEVMDGDDEIDRYITRMRR